MVVGSGEGAEDADDAEEWGGDAFTAAAMRWIDEGGSGNMYK